MIDFAVLGLPRSGTTWAANWLTTDRSICLHDPLAHMTLDQLAAWASPGKACGVSCTTLWMFPDWVASHVRRVIVIERDVGEVNRSLVQMGLGEMPAWALRAFAACPGERRPMGHLFDRVAALSLWDALLQAAVPFDAERHDLLRGLSIQPNFEVWEPDPQILRGLMGRLHAAMEAA